LNIWPIKKPETTDIGRAIHKASTKCDSPQKVLNRIQSRNVNRIKEIGTRIAEARIAWDKLGRYSLPFIKSPPIFTLYQKIAFMTDLIFAIFLTQLKRQNAMQLFPDVL
jgi:hypothetical protein